MNINWMKAAKMGLYVAVVGLVVFAFLAGFLASLVGLPVSATNAFVNNLFGGGVMLFIVGLLASAAEQALGW